MPRGPATRSNRSSAQTSGSGSSMSRQGRHAPRPRSRRRLRRTGGPGRTRPTPLDEPHLARGPSELVEERRRRPPGRARRSGRSRSRERAVGTMCVSVGSHWSTTRTLRSVLAPAELVHRIEAGDPHGDGREIDAFGERVVDRVRPADDTRRSRPLRAAGSVAASRFAVRSASSSRSASRAAATGSGAARIRAHTHHSAPCAG